jgi:putative hydroxymethylpyrimidine transport system ATP-binding protein
MPGGSPSPPYEASRGSQDAPAVVLRDAGLSYGGAVLFERLELTLAPGRTTCLLGPSGIGKTSLLRLIAGLAEEVSGTASDQRGRPLAGRIAYMAQQDLLLPWLGLLDNVLLGPRLRGEARDPVLIARARALVAEVGLTAEAGRRPAQLSGGMRQRAALARTLLEDRPVVLMDEPFASLDAITRFALQGLAARLLQGRTVLLVTHDPLEALRLGHAVLVMRGRPARLEAPLEPSGAPPRDPAEPALLHMQGELLRRLTAARNDEPAPRQVGP